MDGDDLIYELVRAKGLGQQLILQADTMSVEVSSIFPRVKKRIVVPLTIQNMKKRSGIIAWHP